MAELLAIAPGAASIDVAPAVVSLDGRSLREIATAASAAAERQAIVAALREAAGNKSKAARTLRTDYKTLHVKIKQLGVRAREYDG